VLKEETMMKRVVVTGVGPVTPIGVGREAFWRAAKAGVSGAARLDHLRLEFPVDVLRSHIAAAVDDAWLAGLDIPNGSTRQVYLGEAACWLALKDSRLTSVAGPDTAVVVGTAVGGTAEMEETFVAIDAGTEKAPEAALERSMPFDSLACSIAARNECEGPVLTISTGCTAGIDAIGVAFDLVRSGAATVALAGGSDAPLTPVVFAAFDAIGALSTHNDRPREASRPFDAARNGFVLAEGAAFLVLEEREHALRRNAPIYAELLGFHSLSNAYHMTDLPEDGRALTECMNQALAEASMAPSRIDYVNAHGSSTPQNDICETNAIKACLNGQARSTAVNSLKGMVGHALGASNAIEMVACSLSLKEQYLFPTINLDQPGPGCDLDYVPNQGRSHTIRNMLKLSNGFSGIHSALVLSRVEA
jgi:3-oxoacyl-(acyl-carrier-protein) synthase